MALAKRFTVEPIWPGSTVIIIGGGPSLTLAQVREVAIARHMAGSNIRVIAVNDAVFVAWFADWLHAGDWEWWNWHIQSVHRFPGIKTTLAEDVPAKWVTGYLENAGNAGFSLDPSRCYTGGSSLYQAAHIAAHAGAKRIAFLGLDLKLGPNGEKHWFGNHPGALGQAAVLYAKSMGPQYDVLRPALERRGIEMFNCSPDSALETIPKIELAKILRCP